MKKYITLIFISAMLNAGCSLDEGQSSSDFNSDSIAKLASDAAEGDSSANVRLSGIIDLSIPPSRSYNKIEVDSIQTKTGKTFYYLLIQNANPIYNCFAVYDSTLKAYLIDRSLNGNLFAEAFQVDGYNSIKILENFLSKDTLQLQQLSLYTLSDTAVRLSARFFTQLRSPDNSYFQKIISVSNNEIRTEISSAKPSASLNAKEDVFYFDITTEKFESQNNHLNNFIFSYIKNFNKNLNKPEIENEKDALMSAGFISGAGNVFEKAGYVLTLSDDWTEFRNVSFTKNFLKPAEGFRYSNTKLNASISIIPLSPSDSAEQIINFEFTNNSQGKYLVRFSERIEKSDKYYRYFEYSCGEKKYLLILEAAKPSYEVFKEIFNSIINSFYFEC
jgi:hypothetical protein